MMKSRRSLPPLNALRAFEVSGRRLSFRAAADELGVTQGAVAQQVRALEEHLGLALFQRHPRGLQLTVSGAAYLAEVTRAFDTLADATGRLLVRPDTVTISVTPTVAAKLLIPRLGDLQAALPDVELRTVATEALSDFERDQVDIAVRLTRPPFAADLEAKLSEVKAVSGATAQEMQLLRKAASKGQDARVMSTLDELDEGLRESINDVRELLVHFRTRTNTDDIERALQETLQKFQHQTGLPAKLHIEGHGLPLPPDVQVQVLHVVQEALSNVRKHAGASEVTLKVDKGPRWRFEVRDNGQGFAQRAASASDTHVGLHIMRERAERIGAQVHVQSVPDKGTAVLLELTQ